MNENQPILATSAADFLAFVPRAVGFQPRESLVIVTMRGKMTGLTLRVDLPAEEAASADFAQAVMHYVLADDAADGALMVVYTNEVAEDAKTGVNHYAKPYMAHAQAIETEMERAGLQLRYSWLVTDQGWMTFFCEDEGCCILQQHEEIRDSAVNAHMVLGGHVVEDHAGRTAIDPAFIGSVEAAAKIQGAAYWLDLLDPMDFTAPGMTAGRAAWHEGIGTTPDEDTACDLTAHLQYGPIRDRIMADAISASENSATFLQVMAGRYEGTPDWSRVDATEDLLVKVLPYTPTEFRAPVFVFLGWLAWHRGASSTATAYLEKAVEANPQHRLARLLRELISRGALPLAAINERTSYGRRDRNPHQ